MSVDSEHNSLHSSGNTKYDEEGQDLNKIERIKTSGDQGEYVHLGGKTYLKSDLVYAFGGTFNPGVSVAPHLKLGNPTPMGLFGFATTTLILSFINAGARGASNYDIMLSCALFYGGIIQIIGGIWELVVENTFGATVFTTYGGFWLSFGTITMDGFNIASSYESETELDNALGLYFVAWALVSAFFTMCLLRSTVAMFSLLLFVTLTFTMLAGSKFALANGTTTAGGHLGTAAGVFGCIAAMAAYYNAMAGLITKETSFFNFKPLFMPFAHTPEKVAKAKEV